MEMVDMMRLSMHIDAAQEYFMNVAKKHGGEVTLTFKNEEPYVTVFLGKGPEAPIGMGNSVAAALLDSMSVEKTFDFIKFTNTKAYLESDKHPIERTKKER